MTASSQITDYISKGTHAARPATPNVPSGCSALYYETDTTNAFIWTGSAWAQLNGGGGGGSLTLVQNATACANGSNINSVTLGAAPTNGNLLVAFVMGVFASANTGWTLLVTDSGGTSTYTQIYFKVAGASESATQQPIASGNSTTAITIYEISGGAAPTAGWAFQDATATAHSVNPQAFSSNGLFIGAVHSESTTTLPSSYSSGIVADSSAVGATVAQQGFHYPAPPQGTGTTLTATYAASTNARIAAIFLK